MPLNPSTRKRSNTRPKAYAALLAALLTFAAAALSGVGASAQRRNDNTQQSGGASSRRVIVGGGSETSSGSRVRITSDNPLNDYSAYRSGDRFYVVLPKSAAGGVSKGSGKGYSDVQVQQRGDSVVVSYKVQPGAKPRVEQRFNRLDVVFDVKDGAQSAQQGQQNAGLTQPPANENRNASAQQQQQQQQQAATQPKPSTTPANPNEKRPGEAASNAGQAGAVNSTNNASQPGSEQQTAGAQAQPVDSQAQGATAPAGEQNASATPAATPAETQIAQSRPPAPIAPITNPNSSTAGAETGASFATLVVNNWPVALFVALFVIGLGLVVFARRSSGHAHEEPLAVEGAAAATTTKTTKLDTPRAALLKEPDAEADSIAAKSAAPLAAATLATTAALAPGKKNKKKKKKGKFGKGTTGLPLAEDAAASSDDAVEELPESPEDIAAAAAAEEASAVEPETATLEAPAPASTEAVEASTHASVEDAPVASREASVSTEPATETSIEVAPETSTEAATEVAPEVVPEVVAADAHTAAFVSEAAAASVTSITPAAAPDSEEVQAQTRLLLEGGSYDRAVIGSDDSMARQLIGAELLSALASRNVERRERARAAFVEHGYFDEKTRDVREAAAPAERAAAARSLAIVGERSAAPHLIAALGDDSMEVRRAAVEALGALREPTAVEPLEELLGREKKQRNRIPERIIRHAAETCRIAAAEEARAAESARAEAEAASVTQAAVATETIEEAAPLVEEIPTPTEEVPTATTEIEPVAEEPALPFESATTEIEPAPAEPQTSVEIQPVEEPSHVAEPEAAPAEVSLEAAEPHEPAREVGIAPVTEFEEAAPAAEVKELAPASAHEDVAAAESNAVEPFFATTTPALESAAAEPEVTEEPAAEPFEEIESTTAVAPFVSSGEREETARAGEWVEFDVNDLGASETAAATPTAAEPFFESSSGEVMSPAAEVESHATAFEAAPVEPEDQTRAAAPEFEFGHAAAPESAVEPASNFTTEAVTAPLTGTQEKGVVPFNENSTVPAVIQQRLTSRDAHVRAAAITELSHVDSDEAFHQICSAFDDESKDVRSAAARALYELRTDRAESFTRALREASSERRRNVGAAISASGLAGEAISQLTGESRDKTYEAFSLLFLMAKAGEVQPLVRAIEGHPNNEVRLAVVKLLALSGQKEILPAFRRLAVRGSLPTEVRSAVMEAIYQISSSQPTAA